MVFFSTPFDFTSVDFLESLDVPLYKIASFELVDLPLIQRIAQTGKPAILSTGMATLGEMDETVRAFRDAGGARLTLLKCTSAYPAPPEEMNLRTIPSGRGLSNASRTSDHSLGFAVPVAAVALGACVIEKHLNLSRSESDQTVRFPPSARSSRPWSMPSRSRTRPRHSQLRRQRKGKVQPVLPALLFIVEDVKAGERFTETNVVRSVPVTACPQNT